MPAPQVEKEQEGPSAWQVWRNGSPKVDDRPFYRANNFRRACRRWLLPYIKARLFSQDFRPISLSTCNYQVSHYSQSWLRSLQWVAKHAYSQVFGMS